MSNDVKTAAKTYYDFGLAPIPVPHKKKAPIFKNWQKTKLDEDQIDTHFHEAPSNIGVLLGAASQNAVDVDIDCDEGLVASKKILPDTGMVFGRKSKPASHFIYKCQDGAPKSHKFCDVDGACLIELRSDSQQTIFPPSTHPSGEQISFVEDGEPANVASRDIKRLTKLLACCCLAMRHWPEEGGRHDAALVLSGALAKAEYDKNTVVTAIEVIAEGANDPELQDRKKVASDTCEKFKAGKPVLGSSKLAKIFGPAVASLLQDWLHIDPVIELQKRLDDLNTRHAVVMNGGNCRIMNEATDPVTGHRTISFSLERDFRLRYRNETFICGCYANGAPKFEGLGTIWLDLPTRRQFEGVLFAPNEDHPGHFNLWQGFAVEPAKGSCTRYLNHLREVVCQGNVEHFTWLTAWMADAVQAPQQRPGTAIVLRGKQGTGKTLACSLFGSLFGDHYGVVSQPRHLVGNFNAHIQAKILVQAEEAFWAGDRQAEGVLKDLVTGDILNIEMKGVDVKQARNFIRLMITSNHTWVIPAGMEERRFCVFDLSDEHMQDKPYFQAIVDEMNDGGREALLYFLLNLDYSDVDLRTIPQTAALLEQKYLSLDPIDKFWFEVLCRGSICPSDGTWPDFVLKTQFRDLYYYAAGRAGHGHKGWQTEIGLRLKQICPQIKSRRKLLPVVDGGGVGYEKKQQGIYELPDLQTCRKLFNAATDTEHPWPESENEDPLSVNDGDGDFSKVL